VPLYYAFCDDYHFPVFEPFLPFQSDILKRRDVLGENVLFRAARTGCVEAIEWFQKLDPVPVSFYEAKKEVNYTGSEPRARDG